MQNLFKFLWNNTVSGKAEKKPPKGGRVMAEDYEKTKKQRGVTRMGKKLASVGCGSGGT